MSKRKNKNVEKIIVSFIFIGIVIISGIFGINNSKIQNIANQIGLGNIANTTSNNVSENTSKNGNLTV